MKMAVVFAAVLASSCSGAFRFSEDAGTDGGAGDGGCLSSGACECVGDAQCSGTRARCTADGRCVECLTATDCGTNGLCDVQTQRCTHSCVLNADCTFDSRTHCEGDQPPRHCVACETNDLCAGGKHCAQSVGFCVQCVSDIHCDAGVPRCDRRTGTCVKCLSGSDCPVSDFCAVATGQCRPRL